MIAFEWSHHRISSADSKVRTTFTTRRSLDSHWTLRGQIKLHLVLKLFPANSERATSQIQPTPS